MEELLGELVEDDSTAASIGLYGRKKENYEHTKKIVSYHTLLVRIAQPHT